MLQMDYDSIYEQIAKGAINRSKATWNEKCEKNNKYFFNLEMHKKAKSSVRKEKEFLLQILKRFYRKFTIFIPIFANGIPSVHRRIY